MRPVPRTQEQVGAGQSSEAQGRTRLHSVAVCTERDALRAAVKNKAPRARRWGMSDDLLHMLAFAAKRARDGNFGRGRRARDKALADIDYWLAPYYRKDFVSRGLKPEVIWMGERP